MNQADSMTLTEEQQQMADRYREALEEDYWVRREIRDLEAHGRLLTDLAHKAQDELRAAIPDPDQRRRVMVAISDEMRELPARRREQRRREGTA